MSLRIPSVLALLIVSQAVAAGGGAGQIGPGQGVTLQQVDFVFPGLASSGANSNWGRLEVEYASLPSGSTSGYLNLWTAPTSSDPSGPRWVVQNLWIDASDPFASVSTYFDLGLSPGLDASTLGWSGYPVYIDVRGEPVIDDTQPGEGPGPMVGGFLFTHIPFNAEGAGNSEMTEVGAPWPKKGITFAPGGAKELYKLSKVANQHAACNQCVPMAVANALQTLEDIYAINIPDPHDLGVKGDNATLVGKLDTRMDRKGGMNQNPKCQAANVTRADGCGTSWVQELTGAFAYLDSIQLSRFVHHRHQGTGLGGVGIQLPATQFSASNVTSYDYAVNGRVTWEWIRDQLKRGAVVDLSFTFENLFGFVSGAHQVFVFECGETKDGKWIGFAHDLDQAHETNGDTKGLECVRAYFKDLDGDGKPNILSTNFEVVYVGAFEPGVYLNELYVEQDGVDDQEFIELEGPKNMKLDGLMVLAVGGNGADKGKLLNAWDLSGKTLSNTGFFVLGDTNVANVGLDLGASDKIADTTQTFYLVRTSDKDALTNAVGTDVDANHDGVTDIATSKKNVIIDHVALHAGVAQDRVFDSAMLLGPSGGWLAASLPAGIYRNSGQVRTWCNSFLDPDAATNAAQKRTPGAVNVTCATTESCNGVKSGFNCNGTLTVTGAPSASVNTGGDLTIANIDGKVSGGLDYGITGPANVPFPNKRRLLCVNAPVQRINVQSSGGTAKNCNGAFTVKWNEYMAGNAQAIGNPRYAGMVVNAQAWYVDSKSIKLQYALTNGVQFIVAP